MNEKDAYRLYSTMKETMGDDVVLKELVKALDTDTFIDNIEYIARMHGFETDNIEIHKDGVYGEDLD